MVVNDLLAINKLERRLQYETNKNLRFPDLGKTSDWRIACFSDASLGNNDDGTTQGGHLIYLMNEQCKSASLLSWKSCTLRRIARSTLSAETLECIESLDCAILYWNLLFEIMGKKSPICLFTDNASLVEAVYSTKGVSDKRLRIDIAYLTQNLYDNDYKLLWV